MENEYITKENALNLYKMFGNNSERLSVSMFKVLLDNLPSEDVVLRSELEEEQEFYKISRDELVELLSESNKLAALTHGGVENWNQYETSLHTYLTNRFVDNHPLYAGPSCYYYDFEEMANEQLEAYERVK